MRTYFDAVPGRNKRCYLWQEPAGRSLAWVAASARYDVMAQGRTPQEAKRRLFASARLHRWLVHSKRRSGVSRPVSLTLLNGQGIVRAISRRFGVIAYGRTAGEAKQRLFLTTRADLRNVQAVFGVTFYRFHEQFLKETT